MSRKKVYEEKQRHGTAELPIGIHKMEYPEGTDAIFYLHWHQEFEFLVVTNGNIIFNIEDREYKLHTGDGVFINSNFLHSARAEGYHACSFMALDFSYQFLHEDIHSSFAKRFITPVLNGKSYSGSSWNKGMDGRTLCFQCFWRQGLVQDMNCTTMNL